jgi:hypothetical protein
MWLPGRAFIRCPILVTGGGVFGEGVPVDLRLLEADVTELPGIGDVAVGAGTIGSVATGSPTALVRASMLASLEGMLRCSEFDAEEEVQLLNNPASWAVGPSELQYQRGSLLLCLMLLGGAAATFVLIVTVVKLLGVGVHSWGDAATAVRVPSVVLVVVAFAAEMGVGSASSALLYTRFGPTVATDYVLALVCVVPVWAYVGLYGYQVTWGMRVDVVPVGTPGSKECSTAIDLLKEDNPVNPTGVGASDSSDEGDDYRHEQDTVRAISRRGLWRRVMVYALEPTHVPCVKGHGVADQGIAADADLGAEERWLRRNYYFIADRRWAAYGAIEVAVGSIVDVIDGIPLTTRNPAACIGRPAAMVVLLTGLLVALVWKKPYSVRLQLWTAFVVVALLLAASITVTANVMAVNSELDAFSNALISVAGLIIAIFSALDAVLVLLTLAPVFRRLLGLHATTLLGNLRGLRGRAKFLQSRKEAAAAEPAPYEPPMLVEYVDDAGGEFYEDPPQEMVPNEPEEEVNTEEGEMDEAAIQRMILEDVEAYAASQQRPPKGSPPKAPHHKRELQSVKSTARGPRPPLINVSFGRAFSSFGSGDSLVLLAGRRSANALNCSMTSPRAQSAPPPREGSGSRDGGSDSINDSIASLVQAEERKRQAMTLRYGGPRLKCESPNVSFALGPGGKRGSPRRMLYNSSMSSPPLRPVRGSPLHNVSFALSVSFDRRGRGSVSPDQDNPTSSGSVNDSIVSVMRRVDQHHEKSRRE